MEYEKIVKPVVLEWAKEERVSGASIMLLIKDLCMTLEAVEQSVHADVCRVCGKPWSEHSHNRVGHEVCP